MSFGHSRSIVTKQRMCEMFGDMKKPIGGYTAGVDVQEEVIEKQGQTYSQDSSSDGSRQDLTLAFKMPHRTRRQHCPCLHRSEGAGGQRRSRRSGWYSPILDELRRAWGRVQLTGALAVSVEEAVTQMLDMCHDVTSSLLTLDARVKTAIRSSLLQDGGEDVTMPDGLSQRSRRLSIRPRPVGWRHQALSRRRQQTILHLIRTSLS